MGLQGKHDAVNDDGWPVPILGSQQGLSGQGGSEVAQGRQSGREDKPRLLLITADSGPGGTLRWVRTIYPHFCASHDTALMLRAPLGDEPPPEVAGYLPALAPLISPRQAFGLWAVLCMLRQHRPDVILASGFTTLLPFLLIRRLRLYPHVPLLMVQRGVLSEFPHVSQWRMRLAMRLAAAAVDSRDRLAAVAPNARDFLQNSPFGRYPIELIPNGIDLPDNLPERAPGPAQGPLRVAVIGRLTIEKGADRLPGLVRAAPQLQFHLAGDGDLAAGLRAEMAAEIAEGRVVFHGWVDEPMRLLAQCDLLLLPSRTEACPHVVLEAFALRVPVWSMAVGGVPYLLEEGAAGRLFASLTQMQQALRGLDTAAIAADGPAVAYAARLLQERYTEAAMVQRYEAQLDALRHAARD